MSATGITGFCKKCKRQVLAKKAPFPHGMHLRLCLITVGFWLPIWLLLWLGPREMACAECGEPLEKPTGGGKPGRPDHPADARKRAA